MRLNAKLLATAVFFVCQSAMAAPSDDDINDKFTKLNGTIDSINGELNSQRATLSGIKSEIENSNLKLQRDRISMFTMLFLQNAKVLEEK